MQVVIDGYSQSSWSVHNQQHALTKLSLEEHIAHI